MGAEGWGLPTGSVSPFAVPTSFRRPPSLAAAAEGARVGTQTPAGFGGWSAGEGRGVLRGGGASPSCSGSSSRGKRIALRGRSVARCSRPCAASPPPAVAPVPVGLCWCRAGALDVGQGARRCSTSGRGLGHWRCAFSGISGCPTLLPLAWCSEGCGDTLRVHAGGC